MWEGGSLRQIQTKAQCWKASREGLKQMIRNGKKVEEGERVEETGERELERQRQSKEVGGPERHRNGERKSE